MNCIIKKAKMPRLEPMNTPSMFRAKYKTTFQARVPKMVHLAYFGIHLQVVRKDKDKIIKLSFFLSFFLCSVLESKLRWVGGEKSDS